MTISPGDEYYDASVDIEEGKVNLDLWVISAVRGGRAHAIRKDDYTWVKLSKTTGDYGWSPTIRDYDRRTFQLANGPPASWAKTKAAAYTKGLPEVEAAIKKLSKIRTQMLGQRTKARTRGKPGRPKATAAS